MGVAARFADRCCLIAGTGPVADAILSRFRAEGASAASVASDSSVPLSSDEQARSIVADAARELGGLDVFVTAANFRDDHDFLTVTDEDWERTLDINLRTPFLLSREAARLMVAAGGGVIVHVGSELGADPGPGSSSFASAKAGVHLLAAVMALDLIPDGVRVCAVAAPEDGRHSSNAAGSPGPDDVAAAVAFCASAEASYVLGSTFFLRGPLPFRR